MVRRNSRNHVYINDGIIYNNHVFDPDGNKIRMSRVWERWQHTRPTGEGPLKQLQSYNKGYVNNNILDMRVGGAKEMARIRTAMGRAIYFALDSCIWTDRGPLRVRDLGIGTKLLTVDCYKYFYGDTLAFKTDGNARIRALLRNHQIDFVTTTGDGVRIKDWCLYCHDFDTAGPVREGHTITYGLNNYREGVKELLGLTDASTNDTVVHIKPAYNPKYIIAVYMEGPQNIVLENGLIVQSTQTPVRDDW